MKLNIKKLLLNHYTNLPIKKTDEVKIYPYVQGYMNYSFQIKIIKTNKQQKYTGVFYNINRYNSEFSRQFLDEVYRYSKFLTVKGLPTRVAVKNNNGELITKIRVTEKQQNRFFGLYNYLDGTTIPWEAYTRRHLHALGRTLAQMHKVGTVYLQNTKEKKAIPEWKDYLQVDYPKLKNYFMKNEKAIKRKLNIKLNLTELEKVYDLINNSEQFNKTVLHMDFVRSNILFSDHKQGEIYPITGILDFEKVLFGSVLPDLGRTLAFLFVDCKYKSYERVLYEFLHKGYWKSNKIKFSKVYPYMLYFLMRDAWKFLDCNPYENLSENEHYNKTKKLLVKYKLLKD